MTKTKKLLNLVWCPCLLCLRTLFQGTWQIIFICYLAISFFPCYLYMSLYVHCSYRIRQLTEKELAVEVSKDVKKTRYYEYTLIRCYKVLISFISFVPSERKLIIYFSDHELSQMSLFFQVPIYICLTFNFDAHDSFQSSDC